MLYFEHLYYYVSHRIPDHGFPCSFLDNRTSSSPPTQIVNNSNDDVNNDKRNDPPDSGTLPRLSIGIIAAIVVTMAFGILIAVVIVVCVYKARIRRQMPLLYPDAVRL